MFLLSSQGLKQQSIESRLRGSLRRESGWVNVLSKYVNVYTGDVCDTLPVDIYEFQEDLVSRFSRFSISVDDVHRYFLALRGGGLIASNTSSTPSTSAGFLRDLLEELSRPVYYKECADCVFFQQKCERKRKVIESNFDADLFKSFLEFLAEKRKNYQETALVQSDPATTAIVAKVSRKRVSNQTGDARRSAIQQFFHNVVGIVELEETQATDASKIGGSMKKAKIVITPEKNRQSLVNEIIQRLRGIEDYSVVQISEPPTATTSAVSIIETFAQQSESKSNLNSEQQYQFAFRGKDLNIPGEPRTAKAKAKESCCLAVVELIIKHLRRDEKGEEGLDNASHTHQPLLLFSAEELFVAKPIFPTQEPPQEETFDYRNDRMEVSEIPQPSAAAAVAAAVQKGSTEEGGSAGKRLTALSERRKTFACKESEFLVRLKAIRDDLGFIGEMELNPFPIFKRMFTVPNGAQIPSEKRSQKMKKLGENLDELIRIAAALHDYEEFKQSPCVLVQENGQMFFLRTLLLKQPGKAKALVGQVRTSSEEQTFVCSALELIYKFAFKHQDHLGEVNSLNNVISELALQAEYKIQYAQKENSQVDANESHHHPTDDEEEGGEAPKRMMTLPSQNGVKTCGRTTTTTAHSLLDLPSISASQKAKQKNRDLYHLVL